MVVRETNMKKQITITLDENIVKRGKEIAKKENDNFSNLTNRLLTEYVAKYEVLSEQED